MMNFIKSEWYIWLFPLMALFITISLLFTYFYQKGPEIEILLNDASGIQIDKTNIRFRGITVGVVKDIILAEDHEEVIVRAILRKTANDFAVAGSKFSLVTPKIDFQGISGIETLFGGPYIEVLPGPKNAKPQFKFKAKTVEATDPKNDTSTYTLITDNVESISPDDSITFRGMKVGSVTKLDFAPGAKAIFIQINISNNFAYLVRSNSVFWVKAGIQAKLGLFNSEIKVNSMDAIINGGIEFATPTKAQAMAENKHQFKLSPAPPENYRSWQPTLN